VLEKHGPGLLHERLGVDYLPRRFGTLSKVLAGDMASANIATRKALEVDPSQTVSALASITPLRRPVDVERLKEGYVRAGFPP
jgi:hypothetical protein